MFKDVMYVFPFRMTSIGFFERTVCLCADITLRGMNNSILGIKPNKINYEEVSYKDDTTI